MSCRVCATARRCGRSRRACPLLLPSGHTRRRGPDQMGCVVCQLGGGIDHPDVVSRGPPDTGGCRPWVISTPRLRCCRPAVGERWVLVSIAYLVATAAAPWTGVRCCQRPAAMIVGCPQLIGVQLHGFGDHGRYTARGAGGSCRDAAVVGNLGLRQRNAVVGQLPGAGRHHLDVPGAQQRGQFHRGPAGLAHRHGVGHLQGHLDVPAVQPHSGDPADVHARDGDLVPVLNPAGLGEFAGGGLADAQLADSERG